MLDFGTFCYLDTQRTGSTFIRAFLKKHAAVPVLHDMLHHPIYPTLRQPERGGALWQLWSRFKPGGKLFFVSARDPVETYLSLYNYGVDGRGGARQHLDGILGKAEVSSLYDGTAQGFYRWLERMLEPECVAMLANPPRGFPCGLLTWRFLHVSLSFPQLLLTNCGSRAAVRRVYRRHKLHGPILRAETLNRDLAKLARGRLRPWLKDAAAAAELEQNPPRENASNRRDKHWRLDMPDHLARKLEEREWFFATELGYSFERPGEARRQRLAIING